MNREHPEYYKNYTDFIEKKYGITINHEDVHDILYNDEEFNIHVDGYITIHRDDRDTL